MEFGDFVGFSSWFYGISAMYRGHIWFFCGDFRGDFQVDFMGFNGFWWWFNMRMEPGFICVYIYTYIWWIWLIYGFWWFLMVILMEFVRFRYGWYGWYIVHGVVYGDLSVIWGISWNIVVWYNNQQVRLFAFFCQTWYFTRF